MGLWRGAASGVGVGTVSLRIAGVVVSLGFLDYYLDLVCVQATVRFAAGSVNLVRLGSGDAGRLGRSWCGSCGCGVLSLAILSGHSLVMF